MSKNYLKNNKNVKLEANGHLHDTA